MRQGTGRKQLKLWLLRICLPAPASLASQGSLLEMQSLGPQACEPTWALASSMPCGLGLNGPHCGLPSGPPVQPVRLTVVSPGPGCHLPAPGAPAPSTPHRTPHPGTVSCASGASRQGNGRPSPSSGPLGLAAAREAGALLSTGLPGPPRGEVPGFQTPGSLGR